MNAGASNASFPSRHPDRPHRDKSRCLAAVMALPAFCLLFASTPAIGYDPGEPWRKVCRVPPDSDCTTMMRLREQSVGAPLGMIAIGEETRDSPKKALVVSVFSQSKTLAQKGTVHVTIDSRPFKDVPFDDCDGHSCRAGVQISADDVAALEAAKNFGIELQNIKIVASVRNLSNARAGKGISYDELRQAFMQEKPRPYDPGFLDEAPASHNQEGFCAALNNVIAESRQNFKTIVGRQDILEALKRISIPGTGTCEVEDRSVFTCTTWFKLRDIADKQMAGLARKVGQCLPRARAQRSTDSDGAARVKFNVKLPEIEILRQKDNTHGGYSVEISVTYLG